MAGLRVDITGDGSGLSRALNKSQGEVRQWASGVKNQIMGAFSAAAITAAFKATISNMQSVGDAAQRLDVPIEQLETLQNIALLAGRDLSKVEMILNRIGDAKSAALAGDEKKLDLFKQMGIGFGELSQLNDVKLWELMAINTANMNMTQKRNVLTDVVGKQGVGTFNSIQEDMKGFSGTMENWIKDNTILSEEEILSFKKSADNLDVSFKQLTNTVMADIIPALKLFNNMLSDLVKGARYGRHLTLFGAADNLKDINAKIGGGFKNWALGILDGISRITPYGTGKNIESMTSKPKALGSGLLSSPLFVNNPGLANALNSIVSSTFSDIPNKDLELSKPKTPHVDGDSVSTLPASADKPKFDMNAWKQVDKKPRDIYSDSLLGIGNFMGQGFRGISDVTTMMDETRKHTKLMENTNMKLDKINTTMEKYLSKNPFSVLP